MVRTHELLKLDDPSPTMAEFLINIDDLILVTGANGFIGSKVVETLLQYGFRNIRCFGRSTALTAKIDAFSTAFPGAKIESIQGNLLSREDCKRATNGVKLIYHLAAGNEKSFAGCFMNSVVTTRNLLEGAKTTGEVKRFVNVSSFAVYSNAGIKRGGVLDERCATETDFMRRWDAYGYGKAKQDELVCEYSKKHGIPFVIVRPGAVYGPNVRQLISGRVGIDTFGVFLHLGGGNPVPLTYIDNCADAIVLSGLKPGVDNEVFNIVDDNPPSSGRFLRMYKRNVGHFRSIYVPYPVFYLFCSLWESYSKRSRMQLPPAFNRSRCRTYYGGNTYPNNKLKDLLGWRMRVSFEEGTKRYFEYLRAKGGQK